jgi:hypothetical protein
LKPGILSAQIDDPDLIEGRQPNFLHIELMSTIQCPRFDLYEVRRLLSMFVALGYRVVLRSKNELKITRFWRIDDSAYA